MCICCLLLYGCLLLVAWQDIQERLVSVWLLLLITGLTVCIGYTVYGAKLLLYQSGLNIAYLVFLLLALSIYFSIKESRWVYLPDQYLGWGDIIFFIPLALYFEPITFLLFFIASLVITLLGLVIWYLWTRQAVETIPLAGGQALAWLLWMLLV